MSGSENLTAKPHCYRFGPFQLFPSRRLLLRDQREEVALIPRYFDLLLLLIERRSEAVSRDEIFDRVWADVIVSDGALTQAVRILRKSLGDSSKEPRYIRTLSRHGYRFIYEDVAVETDELPEAQGPKLTERPTAAVSGARAGSEEDIASALAELRAAPENPSEEQEAALREAAETVLRRAGNEALSELSRDHQVARAFLREARWALPDAKRVPMFGQPGTLAAIRLLVRLRFRRTVALIRKRWLGAIIGGSLAGLIGGLLGAALLRLGPGSTATASVLVALPLVGGITGGLGAAGVGAGLATAEALIRSYRRTALMLFGALGGGSIGALAHSLGRITIEGLFGRDLSPIGGGFEGLVIGAAIGAGYGLATPVLEGGFATPRKGKRLLVAAQAGMLCGLACLALGSTGHYLGAMSLDFMAQSFPGSQVSLVPLAALLSESPPGPLTHGAISSFEGLLFGFGVVMGLTRRPT